MDKELKDAIEQITVAAKQATEAARMATNAAQEARDMTARELHSMRGDMSILNGNLGVLWKRVNGSLPPPRGSGEMQAVTLAMRDKAPVIQELASLDSGHGELQEKLTGTALEVAALQGTVIALESRVNERFSSIDTELQKQSRALGIGVRLGRWLFTTKEGAKALMTTAAMAGALWAAFRPVPPTSPAPAAPQVVLLQTSSATLAPDAGR